MMREIGKQQVRVLQYMMDRGGDCPVVEMAVALKLSNSEIHSALYGLEKRQLAVKVVRGIWRAADGVDIPAQTISTTTDVPSTAATSINITTRDPAGRIEKIAMDLINLIAEIKPLIMTAKQMQEYNDLKAFKQSLKDSL